MKKAIFSLILITGNIGLAEELYEHDIEALVTSMVITTNAQSEEILEDTIFDDEILETIKGQYEEIFITKLLCRFKHGYGNTKRACICT
jgi:predicted membrane-bound spermidine synthase